MAQRTTIKTTYEVDRTLQPIHTGGSVVAYSTEADILATCLGEDVLLTELATGKSLTRIEGDGEVVTSICITPDASYLLICSKSLSLRIFSLQSSPSTSSAIKATLERTLRPHTAPIISTAVDRTGTLLATGGADGAVKVWDIRGGYSTHNFHGHPGLVTALHFFQVEPSKSEQEKAAEASRRKSKAIGKSTGTEATRDSDATLGFRLASGGEDGKIRVWNLNTRKSIAVLDAHVSVVRSLDFSVEENALLSASRDRTAIIWDAHTWKTRGTIAVLESVESAGFLDTGTVIYTGGENGTVRIWSTTGGKEITEEQEAGSESDAILAIIPSDKASFLMSIHADQTFVLHETAGIKDCSSGRLIGSLPVIRRISGTHDEVIDLVYVGRHRTHLALATNLEDIRIVSLEHAEESDRSKSGYFGADAGLLKGHEDIIICMDVDWSGHWLATGAKDNTARLWRLDPENNSFECCATLTGHAESLGAIALPHEVPANNSSAHSQPLDHPPAFLLTGSQDKTIKKWELSGLLSKAGKSSRAAYTRKAHDKDINALDVSPKTDLFASASQDRTVKIWSTETGDSIGVLRGHRRGVWTVKFAPANVTSVAGTAARGVIATGSGDKTVKIWSLTDYSCLQTFEGHTNSVLKVVWPSIKAIDARDRRGAQVASAAGDGLVKVWDTGSGELECTLDNHIDRVWALTSNAENGTLISGAADSVVTFWKDTTSITVSEAATRETERVEQDQKLQNYMHASNYREAITLALQLNQPARLFLIFQSVVEAEPQEVGSLSGKLAVDEVLADLGDEQLLRLLIRLRDWNASAKTAQTAQKILWTLVRCYDADRLASLRGRGKTKQEIQLRDLLDGLKAYTERHYKRLEELVDESYLVDFTLSEMDAWGEGFL